MESPFLLPVRTSLAIIPALSLFLAPAPSTRRAPRPSSTSGFKSFFARPFAPAGELGEQLQLERRPQDLQYPSAPAMGATNTELRLSSSCTACGEPVSVEVPRWILAAMEGTQHASGSSRREERGHGAPAFGQSNAVVWRDRVVSGTIRAAQAVKASPIPGLILAWLHAFFAILVYLDKRFSVHQRLAVVLGTFLEGLVEIEKEVGIMKGAGEALSIGWEATVKGIIAFAKAGSTDAQADNAAQSGNSSHTPRASPPHTQAPRPYHPDMLGMHFSSCDNPPSLPGYEAPESEYGYYGSVATTRAASPVQPHPRALHRNFVSSPALHSAYLSSLSPASSPTLDSSPHGDSSSDELLAPYDPAAYGAMHRGHVRPRLVRQRSATGPDPDARDASRAVPAPPPSPSGTTRGGWAGKAVLGIAERMKVL